MTQLNNSSGQAIHLLQTVFITSAEPDYAHYF